VPRRDGWYNVSTHYPWIGNRTRQIDGAHVEFFRGIRNPIGVKIDSTLSADELARLAKLLNPANEPGKLTLVHRMGADRIQQSLPELIGAIQNAKLPVLWCCDPMHGNTVVTAGGQKTRHFNQIFEELRLAFEIHREMDSNLGGVHLELTGDNVTECLGGSTNVQESDLTKNYRSLVDPRLNYDQAMEIAFLIADQLSRRRAGTA
jgi:3-deoxy-7-phosphoheptulonate synthase